MARIFDLIPEKINKLKDRTSCGRMKKWKCAQIADKNEIKQIFELIFIK